MEDKHMDSIDSIRARVEVLEQQTKAMEAHARTVEQRLRWWRGIACGVVMLSLLSLALPSGKAADTQPRGMAERMATVEKKLAVIDFDEATNEVVISGANLRIINGLGNTATTNGLGNLIVGYNESRQGNPDCPSFNPCTDTRTGSHNVVVGRQHNFSSFGGFVVGDLNEISGAFASVSGGSLNVASVGRASVSGGFRNTASGFAASVAGGADNIARGIEASVSGGSLNTASGIAASVSGGGGVILGGPEGGNTASGHFSSVSGGLNNTASGVFSSVSGGLNNTASGGFSSVSGGESNEASGIDSSVSGGLNRTAPAQLNWAAGTFFSDQ
jgi:hypothetical protein